MPRTSVTTPRSSLGKGLFVILVDEHTSPSGLEFPSDPDVITVRVGEDDRLYVAHAEPDRVEISVEGSGEGREAGVDGGQATVLFDEIPVDDVRAEAIYAWG
jgi:hypothetical protein